MTIVGWNRENPEGDANVAIDVMLASRLSPLYLEQLEREFATHPVDSAALATIRGFAASGDSKVPAELIAKLPALAFGMTVAYTARTPKPQLPHTFYGDVRELASRSDFLVLITPGGEGTRKLVGTEVLEALGAKGILVNVARGSVVDEAALVDALQ